MSAPVDSLQEWPEPDAQGWDKHKPTGTPQTNRRQVYQHWVKPWVKIDREGAVVEQGKQQQHLLRALLAWGSFWVRNVCTAAGPCFEQPSTDVFCELVQLLPKPYLRCGDCDDMCVTLSAPQHWLSSIMSLPVLPGGKFLHVPSPWKLYWTPVFQEKGEETSFSSRVLCQRKLPPSYFC